MKFFFSLTTGSGLLSFVLSCSGAVNVVHTFTQPANGVNQDGANPAAGLALSGAVLCGTTAKGGPQGAGGAFYLNPDGTGFNAFRLFTDSPDPANPQAGLLVSGNGLFGTSFGGGSSGVGTVFVGQTSGSVFIIRSFPAVSADNATNSSGASPNAQVVLSGGTLYGTTTAGGSFANGTLFSAATNGAAFSILHHFAALDCVTGTNADGAAPWGGLILSGDTLFGTASAGGARGAGVLFSVKTNGNNFTTLYSFTAMDPLTGTNADGAIPLGSLVLSDGTLYGTASAGGLGNSGAVFAIRTNGDAFKVLHHFSSLDAFTGTNTDGAKPVATLILSGSRLYGTTAAGGAGASGAVFSMNTNGSQFKALYSFSATDSATGTNTDGAYPVASLLLLGNSLYGTTFGGGPGSAGSVFSLPLPPPGITSIVRSPDSSVTLLFAGNPNSTNFIQAATNLAPPAVWQTVATNVADGSGQWQFTDTNTGLWPARFYRSYSP